MDVLRRRLATASPGPADNSVEAKRSNPAFHQRRSYFASQEAFPSRHHDNSRHDESKRSADTSVLEGCILHLAGLVAATAIALSASAAQAADLPARRAPSSDAPLPAFTWTGLYAGFQLGYEFGTSSALSVDTATGGVLDALNSRKNGLIGGGHVGYLFSTPSLPVLGGHGGSSGAVGVIGIEADIDASSPRANNALPIAGVSDSVKEGVQGSIRGRLGVAFDRALVYATGGVAFGGLDSSDTALAGTDQFSQVKTGYTVGGGVEYAFTNTISARVEYRYTDFGSFTNNLGNSTGLESGTQRETNNRVQAGVSVKFESLPASAPVVARY